MVDHRNCYCGALMDGTLDLAGHQPGCDHAIQGVSMTTERDVKERLPDFFKAVTDKLEKGVTAYGDANLQTPIPHTLAEMMEEMVDQAGWGFINWLKLATVSHSVPEWTLSAYELESVIEEYRRIVATKTPIGLHTQDRRVSILTEEVGEVARAVLKDEPQKVHNELIQVAAFAMLWARDIREDMSGDEADLGG